MPALKTAKKKRQNRFSPSRLLKTNGQFSYGKLTILVIIFVAIGVIIVQSSFAAQSYSYSVFDSGAINHGGTKAVLADGELGMLYPPQATWREVNWVSPIFPINIPNPTGADIQICLGMAPNTNAIGLSRVNVGLYNTAASGTVLGYNVSSARGYCKTIHFNQGNNFEYLNVSNLGPNNLWLGWVKITAQ